MVSNLYLCIFLFFCGFFTFESSVQALEDLEETRNTADQGNVEAQLKCGLCLFSGDGVPRDRALAAHYFKLAADQGNADAQLAYGLCLYSGEGIPTDKSLAAHYFGLAADQGDADVRPVY
jgi:TPR repeat protein